MPEQSALQSLCWVCRDVHCLSDMTIKPVGWRCKVLSTLYGCLHAIVQVPDWHMRIFSCRAFSNKDPTEEFRIDAAKAFKDLLARFRTGDSRRTFIRMAPCSCSHSGQLLLSV